MFASLRPRGAASMIALGATAIATAQLPLPAHAQFKPEASDWYVSPLASVIAEDKDRVADIGYGGQLGVGRMMTDHLALELNLNAGRFTGFNDTGYYGAGVDAIAFGNFESPITAYALGGLGWQNANTQENPNARAFAPDNDGFLLSLGAGALISMGDFPARLRSEVRLRKELGNTINYTDVLFSAGLLFPFGGDKAPPPPVDTDGDGVPDPADRCPGSAPGSIVDAEGCELDSDSDGVPDRVDRCPGTPAGASVDGSGCELDSDRDGVVDSRDACPDTPPGTPVGNDGCALDDDRDGVLNPDDACPDTRRGARVDFRGCEIVDRIDLPGVNFETNAEVLLRSSRNTLDGAVQTLRKYPDIEVECAGHTDSRGAASYNQSLSQRRAQTVCDYLEREGISAARLSVRGYGESRPIADNDSAEGRAANRRVTLRVRKD